MCRSDARERTVRVDACKGSSQNTPCGSKALNGRYNSLENERMRQGALLLCR